jgi:tubulin alpha
MNDENDTTRKLNLSTVTNSTLIAKVIESFTHKFDLLYEKRAFAYWFVGEGLESGEMSYSREEFEGLLNEYREAPEEGNRDEENEEEEM